MLSLFFVFFLATPSVALICPPNYSDGGDGSCYSKIYQNGDRASAYDSCRYDGSYLFDINNAFQNSKIQGMATNGIDSVWLGLTCLSNDKTSCVWDGTQKAIIVNSFSNFATGNPNITNGPCTYMKVSSGFWYSAPCSNYELNFGCKFTPGISVPTCLNAPSRSIQYPFRNKCYWIEYTPYTYPSAQYVCSASCGTLTSIHSPGENQFIHNMASYYIGDNTPLYAFIGLQYGVDSQYVWDDGSAYDYNNFGYQNPQMGICVSMAETSAIVSNGSWINNYCNEVLAVICSKDWHNSCDYPTTAASTRAPAICPSPQFFSGNGTIYSTGYPYGMDSTSCTYIITVDEGQLVQLFFSEIYLNNAVLNFYFDIVSSTPIKTLNDIAPVTSLSIISPTNMLRMIYTSESNDGSYWVGHFGVSGKCSPMTTTYYFSFLIDTTSPTQNSPMFYYNQRDIVVSVAGNVSLGVGETRFFLNGVASNYKPFGQVYNQHDIINAWNTEGLLGKLPDPSLDLTKAIDIFLSNNTEVFPKEKPGLVVLFAQSIPIGSIYNFNMAINNLLNANYFVLAVISGSIDPTIFQEAIGKDNVFQYTNGDDSTNFINRRACILKPF